MTTASRYDRNDTVHAAFERQARSAPDRTALVLPGTLAEDDCVISYAELDRRASALAGLLVDHGVRPGSLVATFMDRSLETVVAFLGILKAGGAYVPLDPAYPSERIAFMLEDTAASVLITQTAVAAKLPPSSAAVITMDADWGAYAPASAAQSQPVAVDGGSLAYVIYTSGSTGRPKGVCVPHRGVVRLVVDNHYTPLDASRVFLQLAPVSFDAATLEIWGPLLNGGSCVLFPGCGAPDLDLLGSLVARLGVTTMWLTSSLFNLVIDRGPQALRSVAELLVGGEALSVPHIRRALELLPDTQLVNGYGPTESTTFTCCYRIPRPLPAGLPSIPIGTAIAHTEVHILDAERKPVADGEIGDLCIAGDGLASCYLNRPELTAERFVTRPFIGGGAVRLYATGDRARRLPDGNIEFCGRLDDQVKISGHRIELGEIETALGELAGVAEVVVLAREDNPGDKRLVAYLTGSGLSAGKLRAALGQRLPAYMVPAAFVVLAALPLSPMGKVDRKALPKPGGDRPELVQPYAPPRSVLERLLCSLWAETLEVEPVGIHDRFFELGGTSLQAVRFVARLSDKLGESIPIVSFFEAPTIAEIARVLMRDFPAAVAKHLGARATPRELSSAEPAAPARADRTVASHDFEMAIIGLAGRFPGARTTDELWQNLCAGKESQQPVRAEDLVQAGLDPELLSNPDYVASCFLLEEAECFDAAFFGMTPREVELMDPQQRIFLECAYAALENAGYDPSRYPGKIGVFGGVGRNPYLLENIAARSEYQGRLIEHSLQVGNERDFPATHVAYKLDLRGPAVNVQTACSTSGVALHLACQSLRGGDSDMVLVGGAKVLVPTRAGYMYVDGGALAPDGHVRAFDAKASGMVRGSGAGFIVIKRLADALRDGDHVRAVVRATAINNDGSAKIGFAAPSIQGQAEVIARALELAGLGADAIQYVETHGTGTVIGDPMEVAGLTRAYRRTTARRGFCAIGSIKTNIGHLDAGAMVAGVIKTVLALEHEVIPPSLNFSSPNPAIDFEQSPFYVNASVRPWPRGAETRRAGVSSFGLGGTNAHVILEEAPLPPPPGASRSRQLLLLSAKTPTALASVREALAAHLEAHPEVALADVAHTLAVGRRRFSHRSARVATDAADAVLALRTDIAERQGDAGATDIASVCFMFPGGGAQYLHMAEGLYRAEPAFREAVDECAALLLPRLGLDIRELVYPGGHAQIGGAPNLERPLHALPTLFTIEYAVARLLGSWGITPSAMIGHSMGEYAAACLAGVMTLADALGVVSCRGALFEKLPRGAMLSMPLSVDAARAFMTPDLSIAAINHPSQCVASGDVASIDALAAALELAEIDATRVHIDVAAHSALVEPILAEFLAFVSALDLQAPRIPFVSNVTGTWITEREARDPAYWVEHLRRTVRFADGIDTLLAEPGRALIEVGPGRTLSTFAKNHPACDKDAVVPTLRHPHEHTDDLAFLLRSIGKLWCAGLDLDFHGFYRHELRRRTALPSYPFERKRFFLDPPRLLEPALPTPPAVTDAPLPVQPSVPAEPAAAEPPTTPYEPETPMAAESRKDRIVVELQRILQDLSGLEPGRIDPQATFLELGFDSLFLTQANGSFRKRFGIKTTVRQLIEKTPGVGALAEYLDAQLPADAFPPEVSVKPAAPATPAPAPISSAEVVAGAPPVAAVVTAPVVPVAMVSAPANASAVERVINQQLVLMQEQLAALRGAAGSIAITAPTATAAPAPIPANKATPTAPLPKAAVSAPAAAAATTAAPPEKKLNKESPWQPVEKRDDGLLPPEQQAHLDALIARVNARAPTSKRMTQEHRAHFADPRTVQGFRLQWKEMVFPIVAAKTEGAKLWDVDGNEYIDLVNGYGVTFLGHNPPFIREAVKTQLERGVEIGPQNYLAGNLAKLFCELTGNERAAFCNTGSEAVLAAIRLARTVTGKDGIATFAGHYHGIFDEVLVKGVEFGGKRKTVPIAPGIPQRAVEKTLVLKYGDRASLDTIREHADELAMVLVEPIRSRNPDLQPVEFVRELRKLTEEHNIVLLFDEMVTGFRAHTGGMQALWGIRADLATYGKVVGGGYPIGVVAGKAKLMDALDGGMWQFGDNSVPEADMTWFAGTFVRHPLAMAAAYATLSYLKEQGPGLQEKLNARTTAFAREMNAYFQETGAPLWMEHFASFVVLKFTSFQDYSQLLFYHLHNRGIFTYEGRPAFFTTAHGEEEFAKIGRALRESIEELQRVKLLPGTPLEREPRHVPMGEGQQEIWLATRFGRDASCAFNLASTLHLRGRLRVGELKQAARMLTQRHEALRCVPNADGQTQRVMPVGEVDVPLIDLSALTADREARLEQIKQAEVTEEFDFDKGPLFRVKLIKLAEEEHLVILTAHHLIADGWSCGVICRDMGKLYAAACEGRPHGLPDAMPYSEWIAQSQSAAASAERRASEAYWAAQYTGSPVPVLDLPTDRPRPPVKTFAADRLSLELDAPFAASLRKMAGKQGATLFATVLAGFHVLLCRLSGQNDVVVGFSLAGQSDVEGRDLVGHCVQFLPLRLVLDKTQPFSSHVKNVRGKVFDAFENKNFTFGTLIKRLSIPRDPSRVPLMSVAFNLDPSSLGIEFHDLQCTAGSIPRRYENFDIFCNLVESTKGLEVQCTFNLDLFDRDTMRRRMDQYKVLLEAAIRDAETPSEDLQLLPPAERERVLLEFNRTEAPAPRGVRLFDLFTQQAQASPGAVAVEAAGSRATYAELDARSNQLAHYLGSRGVVVGRRVAVCMPRCPELLVALLGTLKAGGAYVPLDPELPPARVAFILEDAGVELVLAHSTTAAAFAELGKLVLSLDASGEEVSSRPTTPVATTATEHSLAYVMYTSGSTGEPKGVMVPHRAVVQYLSWAVDRYRMQAGSGAPVHSSIAFDLTITGLFGPLLRGRTVFLLDEQKDVESLGRVLSNPGGFSMTKLTPAHLGILSDQLSPDRMPGSTASIVVGGEQLLASHVAAFRHHAPGVAIFNEYGPTEATVGCCVQEVDGEAPTQGPIAIGRPTPNTRIYILDDKLAPVPIGVTGELCIGGPQVALGYLNRPELTAQRFVPDPFSNAEGARLYRTGDLARHRADGVIEYLGRSDHQVKIRGYRIELGEIEAVLESSDSVERAVVITRGDSSETRTLAAFVVPARAATQEANRSHDDQKEAWKKKWDALYTAGAQAIAGGSADGQLDDIVLLRQLSDKTGYEAEVQEGLDATFARLRELELGRVWAIGCGTGAELLRLAPHCGTIHGTDYAEGGIREIERLLGGKYATLRNVTAAVRDADDFAGVAPGSYDSVIINSVCQYFPDGAYFRRVLAGAVASVKSGGTVFIGDVQSHELLEAHHAYDQLERSPEEVTAAELSRLVARRIETEDELVVDPSFFYALASELPEIGWVEIQLRRGQIQNETTRFHYDVWLHVGPRPQTAVLRWEDFEAHGWSSVGDIERALAASRPDLFCVSNLPNWRNARHIAAATHLREAERRGLSDVRAVRDSLREIPAGVDPEAVWALGAALGYEVDLRWSDADGPGRFDAIFHRPNGKRPKVPWRPRTESASDAPWWVRHANEPAKKLAARRLADQLRRSIEQRLPSYMMPATLTVVDALPLTHNGKVDVAQLAARDDLSGRVAAAEVVAPRTATERQVAGVWCEVLGLDQVGVHHNFFELGGHSLLGIQIIVRLRELLGLPELSLSSLFSTPTVASLSEKVEAMQYQRGGAPVAPKGDREELAF